MKYIVLIYQPVAFDPTKLSAQEHASVQADYQRLATLPNVQPGPSFGRFQDGKLVRIKDSVTNVTNADLNAREAVSTYWLVEADSEQQVVDLAADLPAVKYGGTAEIRPFGNYW